MNEQTWLQRIVITELGRPAPVGRSRGVGPGAAESALPGRMRYLVRSAPLNPAAVRAQVAAAAARDNVRPVGFNYVIFGTRAGRKRQLLDIGMAQDLGSLQSRLAEKLRTWGGGTQNPSGQRWSNLQVSVAVLTGVPRPTQPDPPRRNQRAPSARPRDVDMKILHCHELLAQYRAQRQLQRVGNYRAGGWTFDDFEEMLRESLD